MINPTVGLSPIGVKFGETHLREVHLFFTDKISNVGPAEKDHEFHAGLSLRTCEL